MRRADKSAICVCVRSLNKPFNSSSIIFFYGIETALGKGSAAHKPFGGQRDACDGAVFLDSVVGVHRAGGSKTATGAEYGRQRALIQQQKSQTYAF